MRCRKAQVLLSHYLDDVLDLFDTASVDQHLASCSACSDYLGSLYLLSSQMQSLERPSFPQALVSEVLGEGSHREALGSSFRANSAIRRLLDYSYSRPGACATIASFFITVSMYLLLLGYLKPVPNWNMPGHPEPIAITSRQFSELNERQPTADSGRYTFPRVVSTTGLERSLRNAPDRAIVLVTLVHVDGRASILEVLTPRNRPDVAEQVAGALQDISFRPATIAGRPVATQLVLMLEKIDVRG